MIATQCRLSVIMPCYNVADTIDRAIQSILMQKVRFDYEIIAVDDASTDDTFRKLQAYALAYPAVRVLRNEYNQGNAISFYNALCAAQGDYFCVLDGDDYYTLPDKFQKQVDFLDADVKQKYVGCCHYFVIDLGDGQVHVPDYTPYEDFNYTDFLTQRAGYFHTTTHIYRHIFRDNVPEYYRQKIYRGDTPRTVFHLMFSGGKIKILNFVASVYVFTYEGIWSSLDQKKQFEYQINYLNHLYQTVSSPMEHACIEALLVQNKRKLEGADNEKRRYPAKSIEDCLKRAHRYAQIYAFREKDYFLKNIYASEYLDTLCATLGSVYRIHHPEQVQKVVHDKHLAIFMWQLNPYGGGLFREITELLQIYSDWRIKVIVTDRNSDICPAQAEWQDFHHVDLIKVPQDCNDTVGFLSKVLCEFGPEKLYDYCSHVDVFSPASIQPGVCKNICLFSYDHGFLSGLHNPFLDTIIAKRPADYTMLTHNFGSERIAYIPTWNILLPVDDLNYEPFCGHDRLITASGAARFYKLDGGWPYRYEDYIVDLLQTTGGKHIHIGEIPSDRLAKIKEHLTEAGVPQENFVYFEWVDYLPRFFLENRIDIFIEPFPTVSYKMTLDMLATGIPVIVFDAVKRMEMTDFIYPQAMKWRNKEQFIQILSHVTREQLAEHSRLSKEYYRNNHAIEVIKPYILADTSLCIPGLVPITDKNIIDVCTQERLYQDCSRFQIMSETPLSTEPRRPGTQGQSGMAGKNAKAASAQIARQASAVKKETQTAKEEGKWIISEAETIRQSRTYKLGYAVLFIPRSIKFFLMQFPKAGIGGALRELRKPDALTLRCNNPTVDLAYVKGSACMKVGQFLALPYRALLKAYRILPWVGMRTRRQMLEEGLLRMEKLDATHAGLDARISDLNDAFAKKQEALSKMDERLCAQYRVLSEGIETLYKTDEQLAEQHRALSESLKVLPDIRAQVSGVQKTLRQADELHVAEKTLLNAHSRQLKELVWAHVFHDTIIKSTWLRNQAFSLSNWAIGYPFAYVLYRVLEQIKPQNILELGLGESTKLISQYAMANEQVKHTVIEANSAWVGFFEQENSMPSNTRLCMLPYKLVLFEDAPQVRMYQGFEKETDGQVYDLICIDAPSAEEMSQYSRVDVFSLFPKGLNARFVIMLDDVHRSGEANVAKLLDAKLNELMIPFVTKTYGGLKDFRLWCSPDVAFLCSL